MHFNLQTVAVAVLVSLASAQDTILTTSSDAVAAAITPDATPALDPAKWSPLTTIIAPSPDAAAGPLPTPTPNAASALAAAAAAVDLKDREIVNAAAAALATDAAQVPAITTLWLNNVAVVYTQLFSAVPDQWSSPAVGEIGFGTLKATATEKKREVEARATAVAVPEKRENAGVKGVSVSFGLLEVVGLGLAAVGGAMVVLA